MHHLRTRINNGFWALVLLIVIEFLTSRVSKQLTIGPLEAAEPSIPSGVLYWGWVGIAVLCLTAVAILWTLDRPRLLRLSVFLVNGLFTLQLFWAAVLIVIRLIQQVKVAVATLMIDAVTLFIINILVYSLWYWFIETGNTRRGRATEGPAWDFAFPQRQSDIPGYTDWQPNVIDYIFVAFTTSVAFSPTDTPPLSHAAKLLMMSQSAISLITIVVVAGTAINILAGGG